DLHKSRLGAAPVKSVLPEAGVVIRRFSRGRTFLALALFVAVPVLGLWRGPVTPTAQAAFPGRNGLLVFTVSKIADPTASHGGVDFDLFSVSSSGAALTQITSGPEDDYDPAWSPTSDRIAFARSSGLNTQQDIFVMPAGGGSATNLTATVLNNDHSPTWSPDGTKIAFVSEHESPAVTYVGLRAAQIFVMDADGGNVRQLTLAGSHQLSPAWSPDGKMIAYIHLGSNEIRVMRPDGSGSRTVVRPPVPLEGLSGLSWSPDGRRIAFQTTTDDIWVVASDGSALRNLSAARKSGLNRDPSWSPDGQWIAFLGGEPDDMRLYKMRPDGSDVTSIVDIRLTSETAGKIDWGPRP
ncbi:MAG: hypothetical protein ABR505_02060, partial [Actinomycetota bacterium]